MQSPGETEALRPIVEQFCDEPVKHIAPLGNGHIHQTYLVSLAGNPGQLVLQRVNTHVFSNLDAVMQNIVRVTSHLRARLTRENASDLDRRILSLRFTHGGKTHHVDPWLGAFRMFVFIDGSLTLQRLASASEGFEAGRACGELARLLSDLPPALLHTTLPDFHATDRRFDALEDPPVRRRLCLSAVFRHPLAAPSAAADGGRPWLNYSTLWPVRRCVGVAAQVRSFRSRAQISILRERHEQVAADRWQADATQAAFGRRDEPQARIVE